jgi:hypothetical protein
MKRIEEIVNLIDGLRLDLEVAVKEELPINAKVYWMKQGRRYRARLTGLVIDHAVGSVKVRNIETGASYWISVERLTSKYGGGLV